MSDAWKPEGIIPTDAQDETIEALARVYVGRLASVDEAEVVLGAHERAEVLAAKAAVACCVAAGREPRLCFSGPPLRIDVEERR